ncbi:hypothetical protein [Rathayibacter soli]|uniref:hypothetical protein n=1 Tax=Rathayibacter soli TaxID=3144168 RepID=UPI0027E41BDF|nr:hypothetical protein [Glaciibacter superstes]
MISLRRVRTTAAIGLLAASVAIALAGCSGSSTKPITNYPGEPKGVTAPPSSAGGAPFSVWLKNGAQFTVTTYGSSTCPPVGTDFVVTGTNKLTVAIKEYPDKVCTMDYVPHTTVFATPGDIDPHKDVKVTVQALRFTLPALPK